MIEKRIRVLHVIVQPILVLDDGSEFQPGPTVKPVTVRLSELSGMGAEIEAAIVDMQARMGASSESGA